MPRIISTVIALLFAAQFLRGETVELTWPSRNASPPPALSPAQAEWLPAFRASLGLLTEATVVSLILSQPQMVGLPSQNATTLTPLVDARYQAIAADPEFAAAPSHLPYCFSAERPATGLARLSMPANTNATTPVILFVHGYGGDFLWYHHWLKTAFPDHILISPSYGINPAFIPSVYLEECRRAAEAKLGHRLCNPVLIGLSAGGFGVLRAYATSPGRYRRAIVLGAYVPPDLYAVQGRSLSVRLLAGASEYFVGDGTWSRSIDALRRAGAGVEAKTLLSADHFFLLTHPSETKEWLKGALQPDLSPR